MAEKNRRILWLVILWSTDFDTSDNRVNPGFLFEHIQIHFESPSSDCNKNTPAFDKKREGNSVHGLLLAKSSYG